MDPLQSFILNPRHHDLLAIVKGIRNGFVYGAKIRAPHATVMVFLFKGGTLKQKLSAILLATMQHARNLATYVAIYKTCIFALRHLRDGKHRPADSFIAGMIGGYIVFGEVNSINQQIVLYVFSRIVMGFVNVLASKERENNLLRSFRLSSAGVKTLAWPLFASTCWGSVMYLHDWHPWSLQASLASSMRYLYDESEQWDGIRNLLWHSV